MAVNLGAVALTGRVRARTVAPDGTVLRDTGWVGNVTCNGMANSVASWLAGLNNRGQNPVPTPQYVMLGTGSGTPAITDTTLFAPDARTLVPVTLQRVGTTPNTTEWVAVWGPNFAAVSATEAGLMTQAETLFAHVMITIALTPGTTTSVQWVVTVTPG